jgi:hypothetical protein
MERANGKSTIGHLRANCVAENGISSLMCYQKTS